MGQPESQGDTVDSGAGRLDDLDALMIDELLHDTHRTASDDASANDTPPEPLPELRWSRERTWSIPFRLAPNIDDWNFDAHQAAGAVGLRFAGWSGQLGWLAATPDLDATEIQTQVENFATKLRAKLVSHLKLPDGRVSPALLEELVAIPAKIAHNIEVLQDHLSDGFDRAREKALADAASRNAEERNHLLNQALSHLAVVSLELESVKESQNLAVQTARAAGATWESIGSAARISTQGAHRRWAKSLEARSDDEER